MNRDSREWQNPGYPYKGGDSMFCEECGTQLEEGMLFCPNCGMKVENEPVPKLLEESAGTAGALENAVYREIGRAHV